MVWLSYKLQVRSLLIMNTNNIVISLDDAFDYYQMSKRIISDQPLYCYVITKKAFDKNKEKYRGMSIPFINSYEQCLKLIDQYLKQPSNSSYRIAFEQKSKKENNKIVSFLWFFEHIDGCADFNKFEIRSMLKVLKKWCVTNNLEYLEPKVYRITDD